jgi:hypothetical protein
MKDSLEVLMYQTPPAGLEPTAEIALSITALVAAAVLRRR